MNIAETIDALPKLQKYIEYLESLGFKREDSSVCAAPGVAQWKNGDVRVECRGVDHWNATTTTAGILVTENNPNDALHHLITGLHEYSVAKRMRFKEEMKNVESGIEQLGEMLGLSCGECVDAYVSGSDQ